MADAWWSDCTSILPHSVLIISPEEAGLGGEQMDQLEMGGGGPQWLACYWLK